MTGEEFIARVTRLGEERGVTVYFDSGKGKEATDASISGNASLR